MSVNMTAQTIAVGDNWTKVGNDYVGDQPSGGISLPAANLVVDGFESYSTGSLSDPTLNNANFSWNAPNRTSIVTGGAGANQALYPTAVVVNDSRDWTAKEGNNSLRFRYPANSEMAEQRFSFDAQPELWFRYWIRVPTNFSHGTAVPTNNKFFALWMDGYSADGNGSTVAWEFWNDGSNGSTIAFHYSPEGNVIMGGHQQDTPFISYPTDQGRWMQVAIHIKAATTTSSNDGVIQFFRRWENESTFTKLHETLTADIGIPSGALGFQAGYLMGWSNPTYAIDTEWLIDEFEMSAGSLI